MSHKCYGEKVQHFTCIEILNQSNTSSKFLKMSHKCYGEKVQHFTSIEILNQSNTSSKLYLRTVLE